MRPSCCGVCPACLPPARCSIGKRRPAAICCRPRSQRALRRARERWGGLRTRRVSKAQRAHHCLLALDGGHGAKRLCPLYDLQASFAAGQGSVEVAVGCLARHCEEQRDEAIHSSSGGEMDCFAEPVIGRAFARPVGSQRRGANYRSFPLAATGSTPTISSPRTITTSSIMLTTTQT